MPLLKISSCLYPENTMNYSELFIKTTFDKSSANSHFFKKCKKKQVMFKFLLAKNLNGLL